ncbi:MAG: alpha/beta hydrolase [Dehalococcoidia bacterium]
MPLDPQVEAYLAKTPPRPSSVDERRAATRESRVINVEDLTIPGGDGGIPIRLYIPPGPRPLPVLVYFHGGGWVTGDLDVTDSFCRIVAEWTPCIVVSVNYRHAPEYPFPAAIDDAFDATKWVAENIASRQGDASRIGVSGASAGGNLAAAVALRARDEGGPDLVLQYLIYPVIDSAMGSESYVENAEGLGLTRDAMHWYWEVYVPNLEHREHPYASPAHTKDFAGLPPAYIQTAEFDPLRDEGEAYAASLEKNGVPVTLKRYDGLIHGFMSNHNEFDAAKLALIETAAQLRVMFSANQEK